MEFQTTLFPYQKEAFEKLKNLKVCALYMEQGTGKTRTALEIVNDKLIKNKINVVLWLCPCSVKKNLKIDLIKHCGFLPKNFIIRGIESLSSADKLYLKLLELVDQYNVFLVVDESNLVKNKFAIRTNRIIEISSKCKYKMILNGTPIGNNEADLFAQWYILDWRILGYKSYYSFSANHLEFYQIKLPNGQTKIDYNRIVKVLNVDYLTDKIKPYSFQITKKECIDIPEKTYRSFNFSLTEEQRKLYEQIKEDYLLNIDELKSETIYKLFTALQHVTAGYSVNSPEEKMSVKNFIPWYENPRIFTLKKILLSEIKDSKCIIFAKFYNEINDIICLLDSLNISYITFTGKKSIKEREKSIISFENEKQILIANKNCGAYGLNLQFCSNIIFYDNDFNEVTRLQAEDRVHRIGQKKTVCIYDIFAVNTIDDYINKNLSKKDNLIKNFKKWFKKYKNGKTSLHF